MNGLETNLPGWCFDGGVLETNLRYAEFAEHSVTDAIRIFELHPDFRIRETAAEYIQSHFLSEETAEIDPDKLRLACGANLKLITSRLTTLFDLTGELLFWVTTADTLKAAVAEACIEGLKFRGLQTMKTQDGRYLRCQAAPNSTRSAIRARTRGNPSRRRR